MSEHSSTVYCNPSHYESLFGGRMKAGVKVDQVVVGAGRILYGGDTNRILGVGTDIGLGGYVRDRERDKLS